MVKKQLRQQMKTTLALLEKGNYEDKSNKIAERLFQEHEWTSAQKIGITISNPPEVDTYPIIQKAWEENKTVVVPKCNPRTKEMVFREITSFAQLEKVYFNLYEPDEKLTKKVEASDIDLQIVPGLAFTREGYRLGFGGGYYDRYLAAYNGMTISLAFAEQIVAKLPLDKFDLPVGKIITDCEVIKIGD